MKTNLEKLFVIATNESREAFEEARQMYVLNRIKYEENIKKFIVERLTGVELFDEEYELARDSEYQYMVRNDHLSDFICDVDVLRSIVESHVYEIELGDKSDVDATECLKYFS